MDSEKKEGWTNAKIKFDKIFAKLRVQTEKRQISTIKKTIGLVKEYWQALDEAQTSYVKQLMNAGEQGDVKRLNNELAEMESDMDETIALADKVMSQQAEVNIVERKKDKKEETNNEGDDLSKQKSLIEVDKSKDAETSVREGCKSDGNLQNSKTEEIRDIAKIKYDQAITTLEKMTDKKMKSAITKVTKKVQESWQELNDAHAHYVLEVSKNGNKKEVERLNDEFACLECKKEEIIERSEKIIREAEANDIAESSFEESPSKNITKASNNKDIAKIRYEQEVLQLKKMIEKREKSSISNSIQKMNNAWQNFNDAHMHYVLELRKANKKDEAIILINEVADLQSDKEELINMVEIVIESESSKDKSNKSYKKPTKKEEINKVVKVDGHQHKLDEESDTSEDEEPNESKHKRKNKGVWKTIKDKVYDVAENVQKTVADTLSKIPVSKKQYEDFQITLKDQLVSEWDETSESKVFQGVEIEKYNEFLELFRTSTGIDDKVLAEFKAMAFTDRMDDKVKSFTCKGTKTGGKYGIYVALKRSQEKKIDVAYAMYTYNAEFVGSSTTKPNQYKIWNTEKASNGLYRLTTPLVEDILTGKMMQPDRFFRKADVDEIVENFIVTKALTAFAHYGVIPKVTYVEDQQQIPKKINQESTPRIEEIHETEDEAARRKGMPMKSVKNKQMM